MLRSTADDLVKLRRAWREIARRRGAGEPVWNFTGLERGLPVDPGDLELMDDELAAAVVGDRVRALALEHLGGDRARHDVLVTNRLTAALVAAQLVLVSADERVVGISAGYTHPAVRRAARLAGAEFADTSTAGRGRADLRLEPETAVGLPDGPEHDLEIQPLRPPHPTRRGRRSRTTARRTSSASGTTGTSTGTSGRTAAGVSEEVWDA